VVNFTKQVEKMKANLDGQNDFVVMHLHPPKNNNEDPSQEESSLFYSLLQDQE